MSDILKHIENVNHLKKKLDKGVSFEKTMHILYKLQKIPISRQLLEETGIGYKLRELSKQEKNNDVGKRAKLLIMTWKQFLKDQDDDEEDDGGGGRNSNNNQQQQQQQENRSDDDDEIMQHEYDSDNRSEEESVSPQHINSNNSPQKKKHKKKKKSKSKENDYSDDERREKKKDKKRKHRDYDDDNNINNNNNNNNINGHSNDINKRARSSIESQSNRQQMDKKCDNNFNSFNYSNGDIDNNNSSDDDDHDDHEPEQKYQHSKQTKQQQSATSSQNSSSSSRITCPSNGNDMFSSMLSMGDQALTSNNRYLGKHSNNDRMKQSTSTSSSSTSNFDKEMMRSLNLSANRYDPSYYQYCQPQKSSNNNNNNNNELKNMAGMKFKGRTQVYAGSSKNVVVVPEVYRLQDICIKLLMNHVDKIYEVGDLPYFILKPVFAKCTVSQLRRIEYYNPQLLEDTDELWRDFCEKEFKNKCMNRDEFDSWRDFYSYLVDEREQKLKSITKNINSKQRQAIPERKTQQLEAVKTPREIRRRQERNFGVPFSSMSKSKPFSSNGGANPIKSSLSSSSSSAGQIANKAKPAPLMKKLLQMRHSKFRR